MQPEGNFYNLGFNEDEIASLLTVYSYLNLHKYWNILARRDVPGDWGFIDPRHSDPNVLTFLNSVKQLNISSFGFVMRQMEFIAKKGWVQFVIERRYIVIPRNHLKIKTEV
jgi:hypothetical protein